MGFYRKRPVVIEAHPLRDDNAYALTDWINNGGGAAVTSARGDYLVIDTLEGEHRASIDDYVIKGVKGEFYPCKPDIFEQTYEAADGPQPAVADGGA